MKKTAFDNLFVVISRLIKRFW